MKKRKIRDSNSAGKKWAAGKKSKTVEEYFAGLAEPARAPLQTMRAAVRSVMPEDATEVISYGIPAFRQTKVLVWYAAFAAHCSLFPTAAVIEEFRGELEKFTVSKGTVQFALDKPLPIALIKKLVKARIAKAQTIKK